LRAAPGADSHEDMKRIVLLAASRMDVLKTLPVTLKLAGVKVVVVQSGLESIRQAQSARPDLIILEPALPDMDGVTAAEILRRLPSTAAIPMILLRMPAMEEEAPYNRTELLLEVARALALCQEMPAENRVDEWTAPALMDVL